MSLLSNAFLLQNLINGCYRPTVEKANQVAPSYSKIFKEMILVADKTKPLARAGKGTVLKKVALVQYHDEIEALYVNFNAQIVSC